MDDTIRNQLGQILERILDITDELEEIDREPFPPAKRVRAARETVDKIVADYRTILEQVPPKDKSEVEKRYGRKVTRLRRDAEDTLPSRTSGGKVPIAGETKWGPSGEAPVKSQPLSSRGFGPLARPIERNTGPAVGREIESWCGPCKGMRSHTIVAMVGDEPKQVLCESCGARHGYKKEPPQKRKAPVPKRQDPAKARKEAEKKRKEDALVALRKELDEATAVRKFERRLRYRVGEIIEHPEHGRGKVEIAIRGSLVVQFREGRKSIDTF